MAKHEKGQYFTTNLDLQKKVVEFVKNKPAEILEPSVGAGHLQVALAAAYPDVAFDTFEIDDTIKFLPDVKPEIGDFLEQKLDKTYATIVGNPPYVKTKGKNLYLQFIDRCVDLLDVGGEMIMIVPSDVFKLTSAAKIITRMLSIGTFTDIYHPHNEKLFEGASIDVLVFRYMRDAKGSEVMYNDKPMYLAAANGIVTFTKDKPGDVANIIRVSTYFTVHVGLVSGKEGVFKSELGNVMVMNKRGTTNKYIMTAEFPTPDARINAHLTTHKDALIGRKIRKFNEGNWFEWGALRNIKTTADNMGKPCIYIYTLTRDKVVAWVDTVKHYGGSIIMLLPIEKVPVDLQKTVTYLNSAEFRDQYTQAGRFKIGQKHVANAMINIKV